MSDTAPRTAATPENPPPPRRRQAAIAFASGLALAGAGFFLAFQTGAFANIAAGSPPPAFAPPDPRLERLLSLTESQRDCDSACLDGLRLKADKAAALEQALGNLQAAAAEAGERAAALEAEKAGLAEQMRKKEADLAENNQSQIQSLEKEKAELAAQMERQKAELEAGYKQKITALETEKNTLAEQASSKEGKLAENHKRLAEALERQKAELAGQAERQKAELEAGHKKQVAELEQRLAGAESKLQAARQPQERGAPDKLARQTPPARVEKPAQKLAAARPPAQNADRPPAAAGQKWTVLGMTASTVVVSSPGHRVVALAAGESLDGLTVHRIDLAGGLAETNLGNLEYKK